MLVSDCAEREDQRDRNDEQRPSGRHGKENPDDQRGARTENSLASDRVCHRPLQLLQEFPNTLGGSPAADQLGTREEAAAWLRAAGLLPAEAGLSNSEHAALVRLRDSIRDVLAAHTRGREDGDAAARLTKALADGRLVLTVDAANAVQLASAARSSYPNLVADIAIAIAGSAASGAWPRLKACSVPECGQAFYDETDPPSATRCAAHGAEG